MPEPIALQQEIMTLRRLVEEAADSRRDRLRRRLNNLEQRLSFPADGPTPHQLNKLQVRLERRVCETEAALVISRLNGEIAAATGRLIGSTTKLDTTADRDFMALIAAAAQLPECYRSLALRLLGSSARGEAHIYDHPDNHVFVERMRQLGLELDPWLGGVSRRDATFSDGLHVRLEIEHDPARVMMMGAPFGTCLAPDSFNFHSAVINAASANKAVVYARNERGDVVGRCLLALTESGEILAYHPYTHRSPGEFRCMMASYIVELATRMRANVAAAGRVTELVAPGWYDDGPVDISGRLDFLDADSEFMNSLVNIPMGMLRAEIERRIAPVELDPALIPHVMWAMPSSRRQELVGAFAAELVACDRLEIADQLTVAPLLLAGGHAEASRQLLYRIMRSRHARRSLSEWGCTTLADELVKLGEPSLALRVLRDRAALRPRDWDSDQLRIAADAFEALQRPAQAMRMRTLAERR